MECGQTEAAGGSQSQFSSDKHSVSVSCAVPQRRCSGCSSSELVHSNEPADRNIIRSQSSLYSISGLLRIDNQLNLGMLL